MITFKEWLRCSKIFQLLLIRVQPVNEHKVHAAVEVSDDRPRRILWAVAELQRRGAEFTQDLLGKSYTRHVVWPFDPGIKAGYFCCRKKQP